MVRAVERSETVTRDSPLEGRGAERAAGREARGPPWATRTNVVS